MAAANMIIDEDILNSYFTTKGHEFWYLLIDEAYFDVLSVYGE